ncbi:MAG: transposase, partial [Acidobacteria bacterium]|nr:transposase [Acidobacteriota bacterium]
RVIGDKGYSAKRIRGYLRQRGMRITIPRRRNECRSGPFNRAVYRTRNRIERLINRCKQFRPLATRYEKRAVTYPCHVADRRLSALAIVCKHALDPGGRSMEQMIQVPLNFRMCVFCRLGRPTEGSGLIQVESAVERVVCARCGREIRDFHD